MHRPPIWSYALTLLLLTSSAVAEEFTDTVKKQYPVKPGETLSLRADYGSIVVRTADVQNVEVDVTRRVETDSKARAQQIFDDFALSANSSAGVLQLTGEFKNGWKQMAVADGWHKGRSICMSREDDDRENDTVCLEYARELRQHSYTITLPKRLNVNLNTRAGHVEVGDLNGELNVHTSGGHVVAGAVTGKTNINTAGGHITMRDSGGPANLITAGGHIEVGDVRGDLVARTAGGHISTGKVNGKVKAKTAGGHISIEQATGSIDAVTVGGGVTAKFAGQPVEDSRLETSAGSVSVEIASNVKLDVDASSFNGRVYSDYDLETADRDGHRQNYSARINGGGPKLKLRTSYGSIRLNRYQAAF
jgi:DUF4097 and DUF4098 domain-containing protein YvlB